MNTSQTSTFVSFTINKIFSPNKRASTLMISAHLSSLNLKKWGWLMLSKTCPLRMEHQVRVTALWRS